MGRAASSGNAALTMVKIDVV